jgi:glycerol kinase
MNFPSLNISEVYDLNETIKRLVLQVLNVLGQSAQSNVVMYGVDAFPAGLVSATLGTSNFIVANK